MSFLPWIQHCTLINSLYYLCCILPLMKQNFVALCYLVVVQNSCLTENSGIILKKKYLFGVFLFCFAVWVCLMVLNLYFFLHDRLFFISCTTYFKLNVSVFEWVIVALWQIGDQSRQGVPRLLSTVTQLGSDSSVTLKGIQWVKKMDLWFIKLFICIFYTFFLPLLSLIYPFTLTYDLL